MTGTNTHVTYSYDRLALDVWGSTITGRSDWNLSKPISEKICQQS